MSFKKSSVCVTALEFSVNYTLYTLFLNTVSDSRGGREAVAPRCPNVRKKMLQKCPFGCTYGRKNMIYCLLGCPSSGQKVVKCPLGSGVSFQWTKYCKVLHDFLRTGAPSHTTIALLIVFALPVKHPESASGFKRSSFKINS